MGSNAFQIKTVFGNCATCNLLTLSSIALFPRENHPDLPIIRTKRCYNSTDMCYLYFKKKSNSKKAYLVYHFVHKKINNVQHLHSFF